MAAESCEQLDGRIAHVPDSHEAPFRQPPGRLQKELAGPVGQLLVAATSLSGETLGGRQGGEEGQRPDPTGPRDRSKHHDTDPAQTTGLDEMAVAGADRIAVDAARLDLRAPAPLDGLIDADHHRSAWHNGRDQKREQAAGAGATRPAVPVEHTMEVGEGGLLPQPHDAQGRGDGPPSWSENGSGDQHQQVLPRRPGEKSLEGGHPLGQDSWRHGCWHDAGSRWCGPSGNLMRAGGVPCPSRMSCWSASSPSTGRAAVGWWFRKPRAATRCGASAAVLRLPGSGRPAMVKGLRCCGGMASAGGLQAPSAWRPCRSMTPWITLPPSRHSGSTPEPKMAKVQPRCRRGGGWDLGGVVSGVLNPADSGVRAPEWRPRHDERYHEGSGR